MSSELSRVVLGIEQDLAVQGWDRPAALYALVATADLIAREPQLEFALADRDGVLTALEQDALPDQALEDFLPTIQWPAEVLGAALAVERWIVPDHIEDEVSLSAWAADHPGKQDVRIVVGVLRDGTKFCALRMRSHDSDEAVLSGPDLVPDLIDYLGATFSD